MSELMAVMCGGFATVAGGVLAAYVRFGIDAGHLLAASVMSAPAALLIAKILYPETEKSKTADGALQSIDKTTSNVIDAAALASMKPLSYLINVARGGCVDEPALIEALRNNSIAGAGIDVTAEEPLAADSQLWSFDNVILTPHTGGETRKYEDNTIDILLDNLDRLSRGAEPLHNQVI